jgi:group I intron endonuclease
VQGIYCIENIISNRKYYGSSMNIDKRLKQHKKDLEKFIHHNIQLQRSVIKHSIDTFDFYLVEETYFNSKNELLAYEQLFLDNNIGGYNMAPAKGGDCISNHPDRDDIVARISNAVNFNMSKLTIDERKLKFGRSGNKNPNFRNGGVFKKLCPKCNVNKIAYNSNVCGDCRDRIGVNNPFFGKTHSGETKRILSELHKNNCWNRNIDPSYLPYTKLYEITYDTGNIKHVYGLKVIAEEFNCSLENVNATIKRMAIGKIPIRSVFKGVVIKEISRN